MTTPAENPAPRPPSNRYGYRAALGLALVLIGIPMLICPGPGLVSIGVGLALIGFKRPDKTPAE